tara:strand:+ start:3869 stop:4279 length:411 start_codon:yes stop_codon:yes gene_type:complete
LGAVSAEYNITNLKCEDKPACALLLKLLVFEIESSLSEFSHVQTNAYHTFCECRKFLESNFLELNSASEIASAMQLDQTYLTRFFSKIDGENPYKEFIRLKMKWIKWYGCFPIKISVSGMSLPVSDLKIPLIFPGF